MSTLAEQAPGRLEGQSRDTVRVGILGYGYWGPNLVRNTVESDLTTAVRVADLDEDRLASVRSRYPTVDATTDPAEILEADDIDAIIIATPTCTHHPLALAAIRAGKHVLVSKPLTDSVEEADDLVEEAARHDVVLMVDHTFIYAQPVRWIREFVELGELGELYYFDSIRTNLGIFQHDVSVIWDLAPHDLSIMLYALGSTPRTVTATGGCHAGSRVPDIAYLTMELDDGALAHLHVSWLSPVKVRRTMVAGSRRMIIYDDTETTEKVKVYDSGVSIDHGGEEGSDAMKIEYRIGDMLSPALTTKEPLRAEIDHFARCVRGEESPASDGVVGREVVRILECAERSLEAGGVKIQL